MGSDLGDACSQGSLCCLDGAPVSREGCSVLRGCCLSPSRPHSPYLPCTQRPFPAPVADILLTRLLLNIYQPLTVCWVLCEPRAGAVARRTRASVLAGCPLWSDTSKRMWGFEKRLKEIKQGQVGALSLRPQTPLPHVTAWGAWAPAGTQASGQRAAHCLSLRPTWPRTHP